MTTSKRVGLIEVGSRTIRYLIVDIADRFSFSVIDKATVTHDINPTKLELADVNSLNLVIEQFEEKMQSHMCDVSFIYGTEICRVLDALFPGQLVQQLRRLSTEEESLAAFAAAIICETADSEEGLYTVIDLGNGSTEVVRAYWSNGRFENLKTASIDIGSQYLVELFQSNRQNYLKSIRREIVFRRTTKQFEGFSQTSEGRMYCVGGVPSKIGWLSVRPDFQSTYQPEMVNGAKVTRPELAKLYIDLSKMYERNPQNASQIVDRRPQSKDEVLRVISGSAYLTLLGGTFYSGQELFISGYGVRHGMAFLLAHNLIVA